MLDIPLDKLLAIGEANLKKDQELFVATAKKIDPNARRRRKCWRCSRRIIRSRKISSGPPAAPIERTRKFLIDKKIVTVPSEVRPTIMETPPFMRHPAASPSMDTPGAFESKATEAFLLRHAARRRSGTPRRKAEHMAQFNSTGMDIITIHEAFPGHYIQFLNAKQYPTKVRKLYFCGTPTSKAGPTTASR